MPTPHFTRVRQFMQNAGQATPEAPTIPDAETRVLRAKLILEEALETAKALGVGVRLATDEGQEVDFSHVDHLDFYADGDVDLEGVADGCADISVVTVGTLIAFGLDDEPLLEEVDTANLRKFAEGSVSSAGEFYTPAEVGMVMARIMDPDPGMEVYDPTCGSAGLLIKCQLVLEEKRRKDRRADIPVRQNNK